MPYQTSKGSGYTQAANSIAKIFVGDPEADALARNQAIKNDTEYARQRYLQEQATSEGVRRTQMQAAAAANQALADERMNKINEQKALGELFTQDHRNFDQAGGMSVPGDAPAGTPGAGFDLDAQGPQMLQHLFTGGLDQKSLSAAAIMPGLDDNDIGRLMVGSGNFIGKDGYVSIDDRNQNRTFEVGANSRLLDGAGSELAGVTPNQDAATAALANQRNATADYQDRRPATAGGKVPRLAEKDLTSILASSLGSRGADLGTMYPDEYLAGQPGLYDDMIQIVSQAWAQSGGNSAAVMQALNSYLGETSFENFRTNPMIGGPQYNPVERPDVNAILQMLQAQPIASPLGDEDVIDPAIFTEGGNEDLQPLQNVGNNAGGQWKILGVR